MLLYRHICLLTAVAGVIASQNIGHGCFFAVLLALLEPKKTANIYRIALLLFFFFLGFGYATFRAPTPVEEPYWLSSYLNAQDTDVYGRTKAKPILVKGTVGQSTTLNDGRIRFTLQQATTDRFITGDKAMPLSSQERKTEENQRAYRGDILVTLRTEGAVPLSGQTFQGMLRLSRIRSLKNKGTWDIGEYWAEKGIWIRGVFVSKAFTGKSPLKQNQSSTSLSQQSPSTQVLPDNDVLQTSPFFSGKGTLLANAHAFLKTRFLQAVTMASELQGNESIIGTSFSMFPALIFGDRSFMTPWQTDAIARSTLAHSLALSGLHLGYAIAIAASLGLILGKIAPSVYNSAPRPYLTLFMALPLVALYVWLGNAPISLLRATCMFCLWALLLLWKKPKVMLDGLIIALGILVAISPISIFQISLQLSAISVAVIALTLPFIRSFSESLLPPLLPLNNGNIPRKYRFLRAVIEILTISMLIQLVTGPLVLRTFGMAALWFPLNLVWLPLLGAVVMPLAFIGLFFSSLGFFLPASYCFYVANFPCHALMQLLLAMDNLHILAAPAIMRPHWLSIAGWFILCICFFIWARQKAHESSLAKRNNKAPLPEKHSWRTLCKQPTFAMLLAGVLLFLLPLGWGWYCYATQPVGIHIIDVGQGQAVLLQWPGGRALIDGGGFVGSSFDVGKAIVAPTLTDNRPARVDYLIHSHPDADHMSGLMYPLETFSVKHYIGNGDLPKGQLLNRFEKALETRKITPLIWHSGEKFTLYPLLELEVLWPDQKFLAKHILQKDKNTNDASLVLRVIYKGKPLALLCGDVSASALHSIIESYPEKLQAEILILPHHGSASSFLPAFYKKVKPRIVVASCGWKNQWRFPSKKVTDWFAAHHTPLYTTALSGQISIEWDAFSIDAILTTERKSITVEPL